MPKLSNSIKKHNLIVENAPLIPPTPIYWQAIHFIIDNQYFKNASHEFQQKNGVKSIPPLTMLYSESSQFSMS